MLVDLYCTNIKSWCYLGACLFGFIWHIQAIDTVAMHSIKRFWSKIILEERLRRGARVSDRLKGGGPGRHFGLGHSRKNLCMVRYGMVDACNGYLAAEASGSSFG